MTALEGQIITVTSFNAGTESYALYNRLWEERPVIVYEVYRNDPVKEYEVLGILPERRKDPKRRTRASVMNWGKMLVGNNWSRKNIFIKK